MRRRLCMKSDTIFDHAGIPGTEAQRYSVAVVASSSIAVVVGLVFSFLPYFLWWERTGRFAYIADPDNQYYLQLASQLYHHNALSISDPAIPNGATIYQSVLFVPAVLLVRVLGLATLDVNAVWASLCSDLNAAS